MYLEQGDRILLCSDGLWGTLSDEEIAKQMARQAVSHAVPDLVEEALRKAGESSDNVTVVALEWETPDAFESTQGVSTDSISDDVFASTIQAGPLDGLVDDLDDAAIERSIAEINEAIRRSAARRLRGADAFAPGLLVATGVYWRPWAALGAPLQPCLLLSFPVFSFAMPSLVP